jgi:hypothetical protein
MLYTDAVVKTFRYTMPDLAPAEYRLSSEASIEEVGQ